MPPKPKPTRKSPHVPGQAQGYFLQETRLLARALEAEQGSFVSLEVLDDVAVHATKGSLKVEQTKSTTSGANPIADRAVELWKTLANWVEAVLANEIDADKTQFTIYVSAPVTGSIAASFAAAASDTDAKSVLVAARIELWGAAPGYSKKRAVSKSIAPFVSTVFNNEAISVKIVKAFSLETGSGSPMTDLRSLVTRMTPPELIEDTLVHSLGVVRKRVGTLLEQRKPAMVSVDEMRTEILSFIRARDREKILTSFAPSPTPLQIKLDREIRTYVQQLEIVNSDEDDILRAINDYLRAAVDRVEWGKRGHVHATSFDEFEKSLTRAWGNLRGTCEIEHASKDEATRGKLLLLKCGTHSTRLQGADVPDHFVPGSFHRLSDSETIGWHPKFKDELKKFRAKKKS
jgi:hypothetical protein